MSGDRARAALVAAALTGIQAGAAMVATRVVVHDLGPASLAFARYGLALLCLLPFVALRHVVAGPARWPARDLFGASLLGAVQFGVLIALLNLGLAHLHAGIAALLFSVFPVLTLVLAALFGHERWRWTVAGGMVLSLAGVAVALGVDFGARQPGRAWFGAACVLAAALAGASCSVGCRPLLARRPARDVAALAMIGALVVLAVPALVERLPQAIGRLDTRGLAIVAGIGLSSGIGYALWLWALANTSATRVSMFLALSPVTALALGALWLGEPWPWSAAVGLVLVVLGLWLSATALGLPASRHRT